MRTYFGAVLILLFAGTAAAQPTAGDLDRLDRAIEQELEDMRDLRFEPRRTWTLGEALRFLYGGNVTVSYLRAEDEFNQGRNLRQLDGKVFAFASVRGHEVYGRLRFRYRDFSRGDSFDGEGDQLVDPIYDRYWYRYTSRGARGGRPGPFDWWVQGGRLRVTWGVGTVLDETLWAVRGGIETKAIRLEVLASRTPKTGTVDFDASRPNHDDRTNRRFYGVLLEVKASARHTIYAFFLAQDDRNDARGFFGGVPTAWRYESQYIALGARGALSNQVYYRTEFVYEWGEGLSDSLQGPPQMLQDIEAWSFRFEATWIPLWGLAHKWRFQVEVMLASGDEDRIQTTWTVPGNAPGTDDEAFNAFGFVDTGLAFGPEFSNLAALRLQAGVAPFPDTQLGRKLFFLVEVFVLAKMEGRGGSTTGTTNNNYLGLEIDVVLRWQATSDLDLDVRYGVFLPGDGVLSPADHTRHFIYVGVTYAF